MNEQPTDHPDEGILVDFGLGRLDPSESFWIEEHLSECPACCDTLLDLKDDTFTGLVRSLPEPQGERRAQSRDEQPTDGAVAADESVPAATMLVQSGAPVEQSELPSELQEHPRYEVIDQIGQGGMGSVYRAQHRLMNRPVALKLINSNLIRHSQAVERFRREVQAAAQLAHPNIVTAYDAEQAGDVHFLAMEFVEGTDLAAVVSRRGQLPVSEACDYIRQAALGLQHAHEKGMVHRDIKPHNLMLSPDGQVRILDFGLAGFATESAIIDADSTGRIEGDTAPTHLTTFGSVMGTPDYIAPEQARDAHSADIRADIYSLGCTLCFLLSGKAPFTANSVVDKLQAHVEQDPPALDNLRDDVPSELADIVNRMMAKDPDNRIQSPAEVATALAPFTEQDTEPAVAAAKSLGNRRTLTTVCAAAIITLLAGVIFVVTTQGNFEVRSEVDGVQVTVSKDGDTFRILDVNSGTSVFWLRSAEFQVNARGDVDVTVSRDNVRVTWMGKQIVQVTAVPATLSRSDQERLQGKSKSDAPTPPATRGPGSRTERTGILTNPPSVPPGGLPVGKNLIADPSLEGTPTGSLPKSWSAWLNDGPDFKCEVVEGGVTGKHCLQISGKGTRGVVFCTSVPLDRTKRYALKGRVKLTGDAGTRAVIKFNYFHSGGWLGVQDLVGVTSDELDWRFFEKTDRADLLSEATLLVPTCHIEGNGTAWFDDLELVAYDRDELPADFDEKHGKNNR